VISIVTELQEKLVEMLHWFNNLCINDDIKYYVIDGTMLGAARHKGFIPWDDDVDVALPRPDYERLRKMFGNSQIDKYYLEMPDSTDELFATPYAKLYDTTTTLIENYQKPLKRGVFIDIFPIDTLSHREKEARAKLLQIKRKQNFFMTRVAAYNKNRKFYKNAAIVMSRLVPNSIIKTRDLRIDLDKLCKAEPYDAAKLGFFMDWKCFCGTVFKVLKGDGVVEGGTGALEKEESREKEVVGK
jgi:lipopolysaccharide cholinephosphotransferase